MKKPKKEIGILQKIVQCGLEGKIIFFTNETRIDTAPNTKAESIRVSNKIKIKLKEKKKKKKDMKELIEKPKNMKRQLLLPEEYLFTALVI